MGTHFSAGVGGEKLCIIIGRREQSGGKAFPDGGRDLCQAVRGGKQRALPGKNGRDRRAD